PSESHREHAGTISRRPPSRGGLLHRSALSAFFSSTGRGAFSFWARPKREWAAHPCGSSCPRKGSSTFKTRNAPGGQPCSRRRPRRCRLHRHQFLFLLDQQVVQLLAAVVRQLLQVLLSLLQIILGDLGGLLF